MKSSTVLLVFGILGLGGVGVYLYLKNKKAPNNITAPNKDATTSGTPPTSTSGSTSVADSSLGLPLPIDTIVSLYNETQSENYKKAKLLSNEIQKDYARINQYKRQSTRDDVRRDIANKTAQANALGYKILDYGEIEKM